MHINNKTGAPLALDYRKAFDLIIQPYLVAAFHLLGFEINLLTGQTSMCNTKSGVQYAGWLSEWFLVNSGIRQGVIYHHLILL